ncbi:MAG: Fe-S cluster domain-containing protein [Clostridiales bacterium]|nr:Fe-S cluster domain-containing protein [Clostridiales bacterium]
MDISIIIYSVAVLGALGALFGIALAVAAKKFAVEKDPLYEAIAGILPGANCGACGYPGCPSYASAILSGAPTNKCIPGGDSTAAEIADILGIDAEDVTEMVAFVRCSGGNKAERKYDYSGIDDCAAAMSMPDGGPVTCSKGCLGYGSCVKVCNYDAIEIVDGAAKVDRDLCKGCMMCVSTCPRGIIEMVPLTAQVKIPCSSTDKGAAVRKYCQTGCIACRLCEKNCPHDAVKVTDNLAVIDYDKCQNCGICVTKCPRKLIINENGVVAAQQKAS